MKRNSVVAIVLGALLAFALAGCSGGENGESTQSQSLDRADIEGAWIIDGGAPMGLSGSLVLDDGGVELVIGDESFIGTWSVDDSKATLTLEGEKPVAVAYTDGKLIVGEEGGTRLVFVRGEITDTPEKAENETVSEDETAPQEASAPEGEVAGAPNQESTDAQAAATSDEEAGDDNAEAVLVDEVIADIAPIVIADDANCTITVTGRGTDYTADPCYRLTFTNKTGSPLYITAEDDFNVNGKTVIAGIDDIADPGETIETEIYFPTDELGGGLELLVNVNGVLNVQIDDTYQPVADYPFHMD